MSAYNNGPSGHYDLHAPGGDNGNHDLLTQQQQQQHGAPPHQPYPFDPNQHVQPQPYNTHPNGNDHTQDAQQISGNVAEKPRWKGNRLRKACDSCSIRKVRVSAQTFQYHSMDLC
jgi:hypothetical protein